MADHPAPAATRAPYAPYVPPEPTTPAGAAAEPIEPAEACVSCGRPASTPFCPHCGERRAADRPHTVAELAGDAWDAVFSLDGRVARSLALLVARPGALTVAYARGERVRWIPPLRLFLVVNVAYFLFASWSGMSTFSTPLGVHVSNTPHSAVARRMVDERLAARRVTFRSYAGVFNGTTVTQAKSLIITMVPGFALAVAAVGWRRRPAVEHLPFALHAFAALLLLMVALQYVLNIPLAAAARAFHWPLTSQRFDDLASATYSVVAGAYLYRALRRAYGDGPLGAAAKTVWLVLAYWVSLALYRVLLFFVTFWTT